MFKNQSRYYMPGARKYRILVICIHLKQQYQQTPRQTSTPRVWVLSPASESKDVMRARVFQGSEYSVGP